MARKKAKTVTKIPLCLLIQRSSPVGGYRLPKVTRWEPPKPKVVVVPRVTTVDPSFDFPHQWMQKYYFKNYTIPVVYKCRWCGQPGDITAPHAICAGPLNVLLRRLINEGHCVVCTKLLIKGESEREYGGIPVCGEHCLRSWGIYNPSAFEKACTAEKVIRGIH